MVASDRNSMMTSSNEESGAGLASGIARSSHTNDLSRNLSFSLLGSDFASAGFSLSQASRHHHKKKRIIFHQNSQGNSHPSGLGHMTILHSECPGFCHGPLPETGVESVSLRVTWTKHKERMETEH